MMKIHTTQNLSSLAIRKSTNNVTIPNEIRINEPQQMPAENFMLSRSSMYSSDLAFRSTKKPNSKDVKKIIETAKKMVGEMKKEGQPAKKGGDDFLNSSFFNSLLKVADYETVVQAAIAAVICIALRPLTIMSMPAKGKTKEDNIYASSHSMASGVVGLVTAFALTAPFKAGADYVTKHMLKNLSLDTLKRLYPQLNEKSIVDAAGKRIDPKQWKDYANNVFSKEIKDCQKLPEFTQLAEASEQTFKHVLGLDIDFAAQKGKSFNELVTKDGKNIFDVIDFSRIGIKVKEGEDNIQVLLKDIDKDFLSKLIEDSKNVADNNWGSLDINSVFDEQGLIRSVKEWKDLSGKQWKLDLDTAHVSSAFETANYKPRWSGKRLENGKLATYQKNEGLEDKLGTEITKEMLEAEKNNQGLLKALTWLPDLSFRVPIAVGTIALIPYILKNVFHLEKGKKPAQQQEQKVVDAKLVEEKVSTEIANDKVTEVEETKENVAFKGKGGDKPSWLAKKMGELYGKPLIESSWMAELSKKVAKIPGGATQFMTTFGSLITSSVYVQQTLSNKDMDSDRKKTLAVNQALCFVVPTIAAYLVDHIIRDKVKNVEYRYCGWQERAIEMAKFEGKDVSKLKEGLGKKLNGVRILAQLATFTLIYRYLTPVLITPIANKIGQRFSDKKQA